MIYIVMGVSGCGKSTIGERLGKELSLPFYDADDFHPIENITKMASGKPLNDADRAPWLQLLAEKIAEWEAKGGAVIACSALKQAYRDTLTSTTQDTVKFVFLEGSKAVLHARLTSRESHFMPNTLLDSQLSTLEVPHEAIKVSIENSIEQIISLILKDISK